MMNFLLLWGSKIAFLENFKLPKKARLMGMCGKNLLKKETLMDDIIISFFQGSKIAFLGNSKKGNLMGVAF
jgi:hypothetical protein